jgi:hypothetical protein
MTRTIEKGFFKDYFIDLIEPMYEEVENGKACVFYGQAYDSLYVWAGLIKDTEEVDKWLDEYEGSFTTYVYFYENGKVEIVIEYPYDYDGENGADLVFELDGDGVAEMKDIMKSEIDFDEFN